MVKKISMDKPFEQHGKKQKHKAMKEAKLTRRSMAKAKEPVELSRQKMREKAHKHMHDHMR